MLKFLDSIEAIKLLLFVWLGFMTVELIKADMWPLVTGLYVIFFMCSFIKYYDEKHLRSQLEASDKQKEMLREEFVRLKTEWEKTIKKDEELEKLNK